MVVVEQAERFRHARRQIRLRALEAVHTPYIDVGEIERRFAIHDPLRQRLPRATRRHDADRVEAAQHVEAAQIWRLAHHPAVIGSEALGAVEEFPDADILQCGHAGHRQLKHRLDVFEVLRQFTELEVVRHSVQPPGLGRALEPANQQLAGVLLVVSALLLHTHHRQALGQALYRFGNDVEMLAGLQRNIDAGQFAHVATPQPRAVDDNIGRDFALIHPHARHPAIGLGDARHFHVLDDPHAALPRALGHRQCDIAGIGLAVGGDVEAERDVASLQQRIHRLHLGRGENRAVEPVHPHGRGQPLHLLGPLVGDRDQQGTHAPEAGGKFRLFFDLGVEVGGRGGEPLHGRRMPPLPDQPRRVPGGAGGERLALQQHDVGPAELSEMIGDRAACDPAADDDGAGVGGKGGGGRGHGTGLGLASRRLTRTAGRTR